VSGLKPFREEHVSPVADLIWKVLHERKGSAPASLRSYVQDLFLCNPWIEDGAPSSVFEDSQDKIVGFFGAVPRRMSIQGRHIRLAFGSNFVVDPESRASMMAIQLVKAFMKGPQDVSITDSANDMSRTLLRSMGFSIVPIYSLQWVRPLRPAQYGLTAFSRLAKKRSINLLSSIAAPFCSLADHLATHVRFSPLRHLPPATDDEEMDIAALLECLTTIPAKNWLLPEYDQASLTWLFDFIAKRKVFGNLRKALVRDKDGAILGWYVYHLSSTGLGDVLQIGAHSRSVGVVLDHLFLDAWKRGAVGLHGRMEPQFMQELTARYCFFFRHGSWTLVHSSQTDMVSMLQSGTAFFSRLDGEWSLRHGSVAS
jgi:hypothetical protein